MLSALPPARSWRAGRFGLRLTAGCPVGMVTPVLVTQNLAAYAEISDNGRSAAAGRRGFAGRRQLGDSAVRGGDGNAVTSSEVLNRRK